MPRRVMFLLYAITLSVLSARTASAQNPFVIDGVVPANGSPGGADPVQTNDPFGSVQELGALNSNTTKVGVINSDVPPTLDFTNPNGQVDLRRIWTQTAKATNGHIWFYFAWERDANSGSGFISFEFQQGALSPSCVYTASTIDMIKPESAAETQLKNTCNPWAGRQAGDFLILWDQSGNALSITKRVFNGTVFGPSVPLGTAAPAISADGFKGEAAIDLTVDVFPAGSCVSFANIIPGTVTGNSDTADYKDTVLSAFEPVSNCGSVKIVKATVPTSQTGTFPYTLARQDGSALRFDGTTQLADTLTFDGDSDTYLSLKEGSNYTLTEGAQTSPWQLTSISCAIGPNGTSTDITTGGTFEIVATKLTTCTITNTRRRGAIQVIKHVVNNNGGTAVASDFTITLQDTNPTTTPFSGHESPGDTYTFDEGHAFNVSESGPTGYTPSLAGDCSGTIVAGVTKTCTITNDDNPASLTIVKRIVNNNGGTKTVAGFGITTNAGTLTFGTAVTDNDALKYTSNKLTGLSAATSYSLHEDDVADYTEGSWSCTTGSTVGSSNFANGSVTLAPGADVTCTITNNDDPQKNDGHTTPSSSVTLNDSASISKIRLLNGTTYKVTFRLYTQANCSGTPIFVATRDLGLAPNPNDSSLKDGTASTTDNHPNYTDSGSNVVSQTGKYYWTVSMDSDANNQGIVETCGAELTDLTITNTGN